MSSKTDTHPLGPSVPALFQVLGEGQQHLQDTGVVHWQIPLRFEASWAKDPVCRWHQQHVQEQWNAAYPAWMLFSCCWMPPNWFKIWFNCGWIAMKGALGIRASSADAPTRCWLSTLKLGCWAAIVVTQKGYDEVVSYEQDEDDQPCQSSHGFTVIWLDRETVVL
jgi:hypothetical protein